MYTLASAFHPSQKLISAYSNLLLGRICWGLEVLPSTGDSELSDLLLTILTTPLKFMVSPISCSLLKEQLQDREKSLILFSFICSNLRNEVALFIMRNNKLQNNYILFCYRRKTATMALHPQLLPEKNPCILSLSSATVQFMLIGNYLPWLP